MYCTYHWPGLNDTDRQSDDDVEDVQEMLTERHTPPLRV
jgi:hypothetical protein